MIAKLNTIITWITEFKKLSPVIFRMIFLTHLIAADFLLLELLELLLSETVAGGLCGSDLGVTCDRVAFLSISGGLGYFLHLEEDWLEITLCSN
jgi:hypothetical protein